MREMGREEKRSHCMFHLFFVVVEILVSCKVFSIVCILESGDSLVFSWDSLVFDRSRVCICEFSILGNIDVLIARHALKLSFNRRLPRGNFYFKLSTHSSIRLARSTISPISRDIATFYHYVTMLYYF